MLSEQTWVLAQDLIRVIFEDMDPIWLRSMWETEGSARAYMIEILISFALLKLKSRLWSIDSFENYLDVMLFWVVSLFLMMVRWPIHWWQSMILWLCSILSLVFVVWFLFTVSNFHSLSKVLCYSFHVTTGFAIAFSLWRER